MGLRTLLRFAPVLGVALFLLVLGAGVAWADDCTDWGNCAMAPRNIDVATGVAAAGPFILLGWRYLARRNGAVAPGLAPPLSAAELQTDADELKAEFERLQQALSDEVFSQLRTIRDFDKSYNEKWQAAADALGDYLKAYPDMLPDLQAIWEQFGDRDKAREIAQWADTAIMLASLGAGVYRAGAAAAAGGAAARMAALRAARAKAGAESVKRLQARLAAQAKAEEAASRAIAGKVRKDVDDAFRVADRAEDEGRILREINNVNKGSGPRCNNCLDTALATDRTLGGASTTARARAAPGFHTELEQAYGHKFYPVSSKADLDAVIANAPPGSRGIARVKWKGVNVGHLFNATNRRGRTFYPDGQTGGMFDHWADVEEIIFMWTHP